jgi:hypothetical protein
LKLTALTLSLFGGAAILGYSSDMSLRMIDTRISGPAA